MKKLIVLFCALLLLGSVKAQLNSTPTGLATFESPYMIDITIGNHDSVLWMPYYIDGPKPSAMIKHNYVFFMEVSFWTSSTTAKLIPVQESYVKGRGVVDSCRTYMAFPDTTYGLFSKPPYNLHTLYWCGNFSPFAWFGLQYTKASATKTRLRIKYGFIPVGNM